MIEPFCTSLCFTAVFIQFKFCYQKYLNNANSLNTKKARKLATLRFTKLSCCSKMTKLMQWLFFGVLFLSFWLSLVTKRINHYILEDYSTVILFLPAILIVLFGVYAASVVLWRVYTFNDCEDAAAELRRQIKEAKADLKTRGFQFKEEKT